MSPKRENFASGSAAMVAMAGSAIGLGNIWRFPYMVGQNGGAAYILIYILCALIISLPIMMSEAIIGRSTQSNTVGAMRKLAPNTKWNLMSYLILASPLIILSYYSVVGGWSVGYLCESAVRGFSANCQIEFSSFIASARGSVISFTVFLALTAVIVSAGIKSGIEKFNNLSLPVLFALIVIIALYSLRLPGAEKGVDYLVKPDLSAVSPRTIAFAMGQSFFSMSLGVGTILTYASYMKKEENIVKTSFFAAFFDLIFAILASFAIMPAVFAANIEPGAGPTLIFEILPFIFSTMGEALPILSRIVSIMFFLTIVVAALTSSISLFEVGVAFCVDEKKMSRRKAVGIIFLGSWCLGLLCCLSFGTLSGVKLFGQTIFSFCDILTSNYLMTFGALLFVIFVGWKMDRSTVREEFTCGGTNKFNTRIFDIFYILVRYVAPVAVITIFATNLMLG